MVEMYLNNFNKSSSSKVSFKQLIFIDGKVSGSFEWWLTQYAHQYTTTATNNRKHRIVTIETKRLSGSNPSKCKPRSLKYELIINETFIYKDI